MDLEGRIKLIYDTQSFDSGFQKREFVITTKEQYPQDVKFELIKDRIDLISPYKNGDEIKVHFNVRGNEFREKYYVNLQAWRIESASSASTGKAKPQESGDPFEDAGFPNASNEPADSGNDDLPF
ncbi:MAG: DUF3127 domain-containing protein [Salibacteraceae bacterium]